MQAVRQLGEPIGVHYRGGDPSYNKVACQRFWCRETHEKAFLALVLLGACPLAVTVGHDDCVLIEEDPAKDPPIGVCPCDVLGQRM